MTNCMANFLPKSFINLIRELSRLPSVGPKSAQRLAFYMLRAKEEQNKTLANAIESLKAGVQVCQTCFNLSEKNPCEICSNLSRDQNVICVVEEALDALAIEKTGEYSGVYHILNGVISPINGVGPHDLKIKELADRVLKIKENIKEIIIATNPTMEGEATAMYIFQALKPYSVKISRIARGLPSGGDLEYADDITLIRALEGRTKY
jgi:recombination protein RecR